MRVIITFALPMLIGTLFQQAYVLVDGAVVGAFLGVQPLAAIGAVNSLVFLFMGLSQGSSSGLAIPISRTFGAGEFAEVKRYFAAGLILSIGIAMVTTVAGVVGAPLMLRAMNTPAEIISDSILFSTMLFGGATGNVIFTYLVAAVRALGDSRTPLLFLIAAAVLNIVLAVLFVGGAGLGVRGAALATVSTQLSGVVGLTIVIRKKMPLLRLQGSDLRDGFCYLGEPFRLGIPMGLQMSTIAIGSVMLQAALNSLGALGVAAFTAAMRVDAFATIPLSTLGIAIVTYVAQNRGAEKWDRILSGVLRVCILGSAIAVIGGIANNIIGYRVVQLLVGTEYPEVITMSRQLFFVNGTLYWILGFVFVMRGAVQGMGATVAPTLSSFGEMTARIVVALFLVPHLGFLAVASAAPIAWLFGLTPLVVSWFRSRKKLVNPSLGLAVAA